VTAEPHQPAATAIANPLAAKEPEHLAHRTSPPGLEEAKAMLRGGRSAVVLDALRRLRAKYPDDAEIPYLMGHAYFDKLWWNDGFEAYRAAIARNPAYRQDRELIGDVLKSFASNRYAGVGAHFIEREIGAAAIPYLEELVRSKSPNVRAHASRLLTKLRPTH
jgi:hypothetical protein